MSWFSILRHEAAGLLELLLPECCPVCTHPAVLHPEGLCCTCLKQIVLLPASHCPRCSLPYPGFASAGHLCGRCSRQPPAFSEVIVLGLYQGTLQTAIQRLKNQPRPTLDRALGGMLADNVRQHAFASDPNLVVPVPLHPKRLRQRGFNQSGLLARDIARRCGLPLAGTMLARIKPTPAQQGLSADKRLHNLRGALTANRRLDGEHVLLIDDVLTTGATADACAKILLSAGAGQITVAVLARAQRHLNPA